MIAKGLVATRVRYPTMNDVKSDWSDDDDKSNKREETNKSNLNNKTKEFNMEGKQPKVRKRINEKADLHHIGFFFGYIV